MHLNKILCPIDFSDFNNAANEYASVLAKSTGASVIYLHVTVNADVYGSYAYVAEPADESAILEKLKEVTPTIQGVEADHVVLTGGASEAIVEYAKENEIDIIVMGTHGRTGLGRLLMGSVAEEVVRRASCPVLAIKSNTQVPEETS